VQLKEMEPGIKAGDARAMKHRNRKAVDPYAAVPAFTEDMPLMDAPDSDRPAADRGYGDDEEADDRSVPAAAPSRPARYTAGERPASRPVSPSASAKRAQPSRKPRSRRGKS
jgi:hypothetical protein